MNHSYEVVVGNIGFVYQGNDKAKAFETAWHYVFNGQATRAENPIVVFSDGHVAFEQDMIDLDTIEGMAKCLCLKDYEGRNYAGVKLDELIAKHTETLSLEALRRLRHEQLLSDIYNGIGLDVDSVLPVLRDDFSYLFPNTNDED